MHRTELAAAVSQRSGQPRQAVEAVLSVLGEVVAEAVLAGDKVTRPGVFTAARVERAARQGRNPQTGEPIAIDASSGVKLGVATALRRQVEGR